MNKLTKLALMLIMIGTSVSVANAQFHLGLRGGVNLASQNTNIAGAENSSIMGINGGATARWLLTKKLSFCADGLFSQFGNNEKLTFVNGNTEETTETKLTINYLLFPLYLNYEIPLKSKNLVPYRVKESYISAHLYGGGYLGLALSASETQTTSYVTAGETTVDPSISGTRLPATYNPLDFGIMAGAGMSFRLDEENRKRLFIDFRYFMGFSDFEIFDFDLTGTGLDLTTATNRALAISVGYSYKLTKRKYTNRKRF